MVFKKGNPHALIALTPFGGQIEPIHIDGDNAK
jgi:hypothetical protein